MRSLPLRKMLAAGITDSTGLAFGWTVFLLVVTDRGGLDAAAVQSAAMLTGVALSAPFSAWLSSKLSASILLRALAVAEGCCRLGIFVLLWVAVDTRLIAPLVVVMNVLAWCAFAAMRAQVSKAEPAADRGRSLTWYAVAIAASEALAAAAASLLLVTTPPPAVMAAVAVGYALSLAPQWWVGLHAGPETGDSAAERPVLSLRRARPRPERFSWSRLPLRTLAVPCGVGAGVFFLAAGPVLLATVLAYERYGSEGVVVSAVAFASCSLAAARVQSVVGRWRPGALPAFTLGAVMIGGWSLSGHGLIWLALAQGCAGVAQCSLEGDLDARTLARLSKARALAAGLLTEGERTTALAFASSSRALGGALAVASLPLLIDRSSLAALCAVAATALLLAATLVATRIAAHTLRAVPAFSLGYAFGLLVGPLLRPPRKPGAKSGAEPGPAPAARVPEQRHQPQLPSKPGPGDDRAGVIVGARRP
jgi:hypothetical protein